MSRPAELQGLRTQFREYLGEFATIDEACIHARFLANSRQMPLAAFRIVKAHDVSAVACAAISAGEAYYVYAGFPAPHD